jgi:hypothetical protein
MEHYVSLINLVKILIYDMVNFVADHAVMNLGFDIQILILLLAIKF